VVLWSETETYMEKMYYNVTNEAIVIP